MMNKFVHLDPTNLKLLTKNVVHAINNSDVLPKNMVRFSEKCICVERSVKKQNRTDDG